MTEAPAGRNDAGSWQQRRAMGAVTIKGSFFNQKEQARTAQATPATNCRALTVTSYHAQALCAVKRDGARQSQVGQYALLLARGRGVVL